MSKRTRRPKRQPKKVYSPPAPGNDFDFRMYARKKFWTAVLFVSLGGTIALLLITIVIGRPLLLYYGCPPMLVLAVSQLRRCYRIEPSRLPGFWHLRIEDLMFSTVYAGLWLAVFKPYLGTEYAVTGIFFSIASAVALLIGCLAAQRYGYSTPLSKLLFGVPYATRLIGLMGVGTLLASILIDGLSVGRGFDWTLIVLFDFKIYYPSEAKPWILLHRLALGCFPLGIFLCGWAHYRLRIATRSRKGRNPILAGNTPAVKVR